MAASKRSEHSPVLGDVEAVIMHAMSELSRNRRLLDTRPSGEDPMIEIRRAAECVRLCVRLAQFAAALRSSDPTASVVE